MRKKGLANIGQRHAERRRRDDRAATLPQIVHLTLRGRFEPDANFCKRRRLFCRCIDLLTHGCHAMARTGFRIFVDSNGTPCGLLRERMIIAKHVA
jgi:hypothetical protein